MPVIRGGKYSVYSTGVERRPVGVLFYESAGVVAYQCAGRQ